MKTKLIGAGLLAVALLACGKGGGGGSNEVDAFMKMDTDKAAAFAVGGDDCAAKATSVGEWRTKHGAAYKAAQKKLGEQWPKGPPKDVQDKYGATMKANKQPVVDAMMKCTNDAAFSKMMDDTQTE